MWVFFVIQMQSGMDLGFLGILPRTINGLIGLFTGPLIHGNVGHLVSNSVPLLFLGTVLYLFYEQIAGQVFLQCYFLTNFFVWLLGRDFYHIGASGFVYALAAFLIAMGLIQRKTVPLVIAAIVILLYGGLFYGLLPSNSQISWESHLFGAISGVGTAYGIYKSKRKY